MNSKSNGGAMKDSDRRTDPRINTRLEAIIGDVRKGIVFTASGFSRTGAFLQRTDPAHTLPEVGSVVQLVFRWPLETKMAPVHVEAKVIRQTDDGIGVQFDL